MVRQPPLLAGPRFCALLLLTLHALPLPLLPAAPSLHLLLLPS
jgi:hypothetical protein